MTPLNSFTLPHNLEAEQALLGCLLFDNEAYAHIEGVTRPAHFFEPFHGRLFGEAEHYIKHGRLADPLTLVDKFADDKAFKDLGGVEYLTDMIAKAPPAMMIAHYAKTIADLDTRRCLLRWGEEMAAHARHPDGNGVDQLLAMAEGRLTLISQGTGNENHWQASSNLANIVREKREGKRKRGYIHSGFPGLDKRFGGFRRARVTLLAGRPGMGKTLVGVAVARKVASRPTIVVDKHGNAQERPTGVALFSMELDGEEIALRLGCAITFDESTRSGPVYFDVQRDELNSGDWDTLEAGLTEMERLPFWFDERAKLKPSQIVPATKRIVREWRRKGIEPGMVMIDHVHLVKPDNERYGNRAIELGEISGALAEMAKELDIAVVALCQLNRENESRGNKDKRPQLSDLKGSGDLEQDANTVMFLHRPEYYLVEPEDKQNDKEMIEYMDQKMKWEGKIQFLVRKNRGGPGLGDYTMNVSLAHNALWEG